jgi:hypothetical protein
MDKKTVLLLVAAAAAVLLLYKNKQKASDVFIPLAREGEVNYAEPTGYISVATGTL